MMGLVGDESEAARGVISVVARGPIRYPLGVGFSPPKGQADRGPEQKPTWRGARAAESDSLLMVVRASTDVVCVLQGPLSWTFRSYPSTRCSQCSGVRPSSRPTVLLHGGGPLSRMFLAGTPDTYQSAGVRRGTATSNSTTNGTTSRLHPRPGDQPTSTVRTPENPTRPFYSGLTCG